MKKVTKYPVLSQLLLVSTLVTPAVLMAAEPVIDETVNSSVQQLKGATDQVKGSVDIGNTYLKNIWEFMQGDFSNKDLAYAMINYMAAMEHNRQELDQQREKMPGAGTEESVRAGSIVGGANIAGDALKYANKSTLGGISMYSKASNFTGPMGNSKVTNSSRDDLYQLFLPFINEGNTAPLTIVNPGPFILSNNLTKSGISSAQSQQFINVLTNPFPKMDPKVAAQMVLGAMGGGAVGAAQDEIVNALVQNAVLSVSSSALADIIARRMPTTDASGNPKSTDSVMETLEKLAKSRFGNDEWVKELGVSSAEAIGRENTQINSQNTYLLYLLLRGQDQQTALLATLNGIMAKVNTGMEKLAVEMDKAAAQASAAATDMKNTLDDDKLKELEESAKDYAE
jgi:hypothetical protein